MVEAGYIFRCADCERKENVFFPFNPEVEVPTPIQCVPRGWSVSFFGGAVQFPIVQCGCLDPKENQN